MNKFYPITENRSQQLLNRRYELWAFFANSHNLSLTESELDDIIIVVKKQINKEANND